MKLPAGFKLEEFRLVLMILPDQWPTVEVWGDTGQLPRMNVWYKYTKKCKLSKASKNN